MTTLLLTVLSAYLFLVGFLYFFQRGLLYHPGTDIQPLEHYGLENFSELFIDTEDGQKLQFWYHAAHAGFPTIVYYHGNAAHMGDADRSGLFLALAQKGFGVLGISYRGYGKSTGVPSEAGLFTDARTAIGFLAAQGITMDRIICFGESLGTGVATRMASEYPVAGLILQAPYTSVANRGAELYPYVPVQWLIKDKFATIDYIGKVKAPLMLFHGDLDEVIPIAHGKAVFAAANEPKQSLFFPDRAHNDFDTQAISAHVLDFAKTHKLITQ